MDILKNFGHFTLGPLSLKIEKEVMVILGPTGSGKTTLINLIAGILKPDNGRIISDGIDITDKEIESRKVGYVFRKSDIVSPTSMYTVIFFLA